MVVAEGAICVVLEKDWATGQVTKKRVSFLWTSINPLYARRRMFIYASFIAE